MIFPEIDQYLKKAETRFDNIDEERKKILKKMGEYLADKTEKKESIKLIYICTHNSRRSHFGQIWAKVAASYYDFDKVETFSGGTEATVFNVNAIAAIKRAGFQIRQAEESPNPHYIIQFDTLNTEVICYSKKYDDPANPKERFCALMTCTEADGACPFIEGADIRIATPYDDPKAFDNTPRMDSKYDERCQQIATEVLFTFFVAKQILNNPLTK